jgi:hypothetical protein
MNAQNMTAGDPEVSKSGFGVSLARVAQVLYAPVDMFKKMAGQWGWTDWAVPILVVIAASIAISIMIWPQLDLLTPQREALEARGVAQEQIETQMAATEQFFSGPFGGLMKFVPLVSVPVTLGFFALVFWGGASVMGASLGFGRTFSIVSYAWLPKVLEGVLLIFVLQGRDQIRTDRLSSALATNPASFLDVSQSDTALYAVLSTLNPFTIWTLVIIALGMAGVGKMPRNSAFIVVGGLFALWVLIQFGWVAAF